MNATTSGAQAIGLTLAFNTIGWAPQNILFNTIDALIGDPAVADAFGADEGAGAKAYLEDATVRATGLLTVSADAAAQLSTDIANTSDSHASAWIGATGLSFGAVVGLNKVRARRAPITAAAIRARDHQRRCRRDGDGDRRLGAERDAGPEFRFLDLEHFALQQLRLHRSGGCGGAERPAWWRHGLYHGYERDCSAGDVTVSASAAQAMTASLESAASSSGGSKFGAGVSLAASGLIATNTVKGGAEAHVTGSTLTIGGGVTVEAVNNAALDAHLVNATSSGAEAIGVTLAFNTLGWAPQNILFNTIDALIGDPAIADAFGADQASGATAYLEDTTVDATGLLTVSADSAAQLSADIANTSDSQASAWVGATGLSFGAVVGLNKSSSAAEAYIGWSDTYTGAKTISADAGVTRHGDRRFGAERDAWT